jgi:hypothetical protein
LLTQISLSALPHTKSRKGILPLLVHTLHRMASSTGNSQKRVNSKSRRNHPRTPNRRFALELSDVQRALIPGVQEILRQGGTYVLAQQDLSVAMVYVAMQQSGENQTVAARKLGVTHQFVNQIWNGTASLYRSKRRLAHKKELEKKNSGQSQVQEQK